MYYMGIVYRGDFNIVTSSKERKGVGERNIRGEMHEFGTSLRRWN